MTDDIVFVLLSGLLLGITASAIIEFVYTHRFVRTKHWFTFERKVIGK